MKDGDCGTPGPGRPRFTVTRLRMCLKSSVGVLEKGLEWALRPEGNQLERRRSRIFWLLSACDGSAW